jgi:hypothetical protein
MFLRAQTQGKKGMRSQHVISKRGEDLARFSARSVPAANRFAAIRSLRQPALRMTHVKCPHYRGHPEQSTGSAGVSSRHSEPASNASRVEESRAVLRASAAAAKRFVFHESASRKP